MKQKRYFLVLILILITAIITSCDKEENSENNVEEKSIFGQVDLNEIPDIEKAINAKKNSSASKKNTSAYLELINAEDILIIKDSLNYKSYTFSLNLEENNQLTNLVIQETANSLKYYIVTYQSNNFLQWKNDLTNKVFSNFKVNITYEALDAPSKTTAKRDCNEGSINYICPSGLHHWGEQAICEYYFGDWNYVITYDNTGCGGSDSGSTTPNMGGGGGAAGIKKECDKIKKQFAKYQGLTTALISLAATTSQNHESGFFIDNSATASTINPVQNIPNTNTIGGSIKINMNPLNKYTVLAHVHDASGSDGLGTYSIFSWDDLAIINRLIIKKKIDINDFVFYVITADNTRYAITIDNAEFLQHLMNYHDPANVGEFVDSDKMIISQNIFEKYFDDEKGVIKKNSSVSNDLIYFLKFIQDFNLGINLYQIDPTFTTFDRLKLNTNNTITKDNCK